MRTKLSFQEAVESFKEFLLQQGNSTDLLWIFQEDVHTKKRQVFLRWPLPSDNSTLAQQHYEEGREKGHGLSLEVFCWLAERPCCYVLVPEDKDAAESLMMTELKFSIPIERRQAIKIRNGLIWRILVKLFPSPEEFRWGDFVPNRRAT